jgi:hypothetical protein
MSAEDIEELLSQKPFKGFRVYFSEGTKIQVSHPETVFLGLDNFIHGTSVRDESRVFAHRNYYAYDQIVRIEELHPEEARTA